jgi:uncharacterized small protein (DUF1192 family)
MSACSSRHGFESLPFDQKHLEPGRSTALAHADALEAKVAYLEAEVARLRAFGPVTPLTQPAAEAPRPEKS